MTQIILDLQGVVKDYDKKLYDSNIKISEIHKINMFSDQEKIL